MKPELRRLTMFLVTSVMLLSLLSACAPSSEEATSSPIEVTDQLGRIVKLDKIPERIISLSPGNTEIIFALGLADKLVAVTDYCDYPPEAAAKPSIGGFSTPNIEQVIAHSPDIILATSIHEKRIIPQLEDKDLPTLVLDPKTLNELLAAINLIGEITGKETEAVELATELQNRIEAVTGKTDILPQEQRPRVLYIVWHDPLLVAGTETLQDELIQRAGGENIAHNLTGYADISLEAVIGANPEVIIAGTGHGSGAELTFQFIKTETRLRDTEARKTEQIYKMDSNLSSRPGPRIVEGLEMFAEFIHPELFKKAR